MTTRTALQGQNQKRTTTPIGTNIVQMTINTALIPILRPAKPMLYFPFNTKDRMHDHRLSKGDYRINKFIGDFSTPNGKTNQIIFFWNTPNCANGQKKATKMF